MENQSWTKIFDFLKDGNKEFLRLKHCESGTGNNIFIVTKDSFSVKGNKEISPVQHARL